MSPDGPVCATPSFPASPTGRGRSRRAQVVSGPYSSPLVLGSARKPRASTEMVAPLRTSKGRDSLPQLFLMLIDPAGPSAL